MVGSSPSKDAVLRYLEARFEFEPLPHYAMVAIQLSDIDEPLPRFVRGHLEYLSFKFFDEDIDRQGNPVFPGTFKQFTSNTDKASDQWRRAEDCVLFLTDDDTAMERQAERLQLVEAVEAGRERGNSLFNIFTKLAVELDEGREGLEKHLERRWRAIVHPAQYTSGLIPVALLPDGEIEFREVKTRT